MSASFHDEPFDEGTLTKLQLFERYAEAWLPVFVAPEKVLWPEVNIFDFFAGAGTDSDGVEGSALRLLRVIASHRKWLKRPGIRVALHLSDANQGKISRLEQAISNSGIDFEPAVVDVKRSEFSARFEEARTKICNSRSANLLIIDQFGVKQVPEELFSRIIDLPTTDVLFFVSSNTFHRFANVPEVANLSLPDYQRPTDYYRAHLAVADAYRSLVPKGKQYYVGSFSIKKGSNVYGVIFCSGHPLGMDKFLDIAWKADKVSGDANFDVHREAIDPGEPSLFPQMNVPTKVTLFEADLAKRILDGSCMNEASVINICHQHGVKRKHAEAVLRKLKAESRIDCEFHVPDIRRLSEPRRIRLK